MSIRRGNKIIAGTGGGGGGTNVLVDDRTIIKNDEDIITAVGVQPKKGDIIYDWIGTLEEYESGRANGTIPNNWVCWITDDAEFGPTISQEQVDSFLTKKQITNCLLEVPQRIKLELNDGVLTLKAGSQVIIPNGFETDGTTPKFDYVTVESDLTITSSANAQIYIFYKSNNTIGATTLVGLTSGTTQPSGTHYWYDTTNNIIKRIINGAEESSGHSFSLGILTCDSTQITSINQIFNGMGYIGSTIWVDKGVKGLAPNGFNDDGTLNNKAIEYKNIYTRTFTTASNSPLWLAIQETGVTDITTSNYKYNEKENRIQKISTGTFIYPAILAGTYNRGENGVISNFQPKLPFRVVDWNDRNLPQVDGQWVQKRLVISTTTAVGANSYDLSDYLPNDKYSYEVQFALYTVYGSADVVSTVGTVASPADNADSCISISAGASSNAHISRAYGILPIGADRIVYTQISTGTARTATVSAQAYRRIGTNI